MTDELSVERLERLMQYQPEAVPWTPVTPFDFESRRQIEGEHPDVLVETFGSGPYLDYGCGPDAILVRLLRERGVMAYGIDPQLRDVWRCYQPHFDPDPEEFVGTFPVVICREVLEHCPLRKIPGVIRRMLRFAPRFLYVTTRYAKNPDHVLSVDTSDDLDPTHITMLTKPFLRTLFVLEGCKSRPDLEAKMDWQNKGRVLVFEVPA